MMNLHTETTSRAAFELVNAANSDIAGFSATKDRECLVSAEQRLEQAEKLDPRYLRVVYLKGIVKELFGEPVNAIPYLQEVLNVAKAPFVHEVRYNLAVAHYHRYHAEEVDEAIKLFTKVIEDNEAAPSFRLLAAACRAQAFAMRMIPRSPAQVDHARIAELFQRVAAEEKALLQKLKRTRVTSGVAKEVTWMVHNAVGMSHMYYSDYHGTVAEKVRHVTTALEHLTLADKYAPKNWANYCDLGSAHMRLGYWRDRSSEELSRAVQYLMEVVTTLRPDYGFALYEIGRAYRINSDFATALSWFQKALAVPDELRDVSSKRVAHEVQRAEERDANYP